MNINNNNKNTYIKDKRHNDKRDSHGDDGEGEVRCLQSASALARCLLHHPKPSSHNRL